MAALVALAFGWLTGLVLGRVLAPAAGAAACLAGLAVMAAGLAAAWAPQASAERLVALRGARVAGPVGLAALALLAGTIAGRPEAPREPPHGGLHRLVVRVERVLPGPDDDVSTVAAVLRGDRIEDGRAMAADTRLLIRDPLGPPGALVELLGKVTPWVPFRNPTPHPPWPEGRPIDGAARLPDGARPRILEVDPLAAALDGARAHVRARLRATLPRRTAGVARTLVLGEGRAVDETDRDAVRAAGLAHVFAVSGLHVTLVAGALVAAIRRALLRAPRLSRRHVAGRVAALAGIPLAFLYAGLAGGAPSAWRAALTSGLAWSLVALGRVPSALAVTCGVAVVLGALRPADAASPSFLLSIVATLAIVTGPPPGTERDAASLLAPWREGLRAVVRTTLATAPLVLWSFASFPALSVVANLLLVPLAAFALLPLSLAHAALATALPVAAPATAAPLDLAAHAFLGAASSLALDAGPALPPPSVAQGGVITAAALALLALRTARARAVAVALALIVLAALEVDLRHRERPTQRLRATFLDVGQGDATLVDLPDGRLMAIDFGGAVLGGPDPGARVVAPLLAARRRDRVDVAVLTHPHPDHHGGLAAVLDAVPVGELWVNRQALVEEPEGPAARLVAEARRRGTRVLHPAALCGRPRRFGAARVDVLAPCPAYDAGLEANDNSIAIRMTLGRHRLLFTGDAEVAGEARLAALPGLRADVLQVGHHGSDTSTTAGLLDAVHPRLAVVSAGLRNRYGHPSPRVIARLRAADARVLRTDRMGGVTVETDGRRLRWRSWSGASGG